MEAGVTIKEVESKCMGGGGGASGLRGSRQLATTLHPRTGGCTPEHLVSRVAHSQ